MSESDTATEARDTAAAKKYYEAGRAAEDRGDRLEAIESYEDAYTADPDDSNICFRLAYCLDLVGEEDQALHLYEACAQDDKPHLHALMNLAVLYEDRGKIAHAERCLRQVLTTEPNNPRARLFIKDIVAAKGMVIDDEAEKKLEKHHALLDIPVTDFDLMVRTRNALRKMDIRTLGDLLRITEAELRNYKNFGDASLEEIKTMLSQRGLRLGQAVEQQQQQNKQQLQSESGGQNEVLQKSINEMDLSVRARKALSLLSATTIGDLCMKTEAELMGVKNFGMTSLVEIKEKLAEMGVGLRSLETENQDQES